MGFFAVADADRQSRHAWPLCYLVSIRKLRVRRYWFLIRKEGIFCPGKETKGLRGGVHGYVAQASPLIDTARAKKHPFRTETIYTQDFFTCSWVNMWSRQ
jgi:hypothetical protein